MRVFQQAPRRGDLLPRPHRFVAVCICGVCAVWPVLLAAQSGDGRDEVVVHAVTLRYQQAADAVGLVYPMLTDAGTVELQPGGNTLVLRDVRTAVDRILPRLRRFDQPSRSLRIAVQIVSAGAAEAGRGREPQLSPDVLARLRELLRYRSYSLLGRAELEVPEGHATAYEVGEEYQVDFRLGKMNGRRLNLQGFRVLRLGDDGNLRPLIHTNLNLSLDQPLVLGLAKTESSDRALMVVLQLVDMKTRTARR